MLHERPSAGGTVKIEPNAPDIRGLRERDVSGSASERRDLQSFGSGLLVRGEGGAGGGEDGGGEGGEGQTRTLDGKVPCHLSRGARWV